MNKQEKEKMTTLTTNNCQKNRMLKKTEIDTGTQQKYLN